MIRLLPIALCLALSACTSLDVSKGKYYTNADNEDVEIHAQGGQITFYKARINNHSGPIRSYGSVIGTTGAAGMGIIAAGVTHGIIK